jgi:hypothetical protein
VSVTCSAIGDGPASIECELDQTLAVPGTLAAVTAAASAGADARGLTGGTIMPGMRQPGSKHGATSSNASKSWKRNTDLTCDAVTAGSGVNLLQQVRP